MNIHRYYLLGIDFDCYTDHQPLIPIYTRGSKKGPARVERHLLSAQDFHFTIRYTPGKSNPCDYNSRHSLSHEQARGTDTLLDYDDELFISWIITNDLPYAVVTLPMVERVTATDPIMQKLISFIKKGYISEDPDLQPYKQVFQELTFTQGVILRGERLVIPRKELAPGEGNLQQLAVDLAHEGHQGEVKCKRILCSKLWFPNLDQLVQEKVAGCQATTYTPTRDGVHYQMEHMLVMIDKYSRYPTVDFVNSTAAKAVIPHIDTSFSTHGFPETVKTDGGPPFNGTD